MSKTPHGARKSDEQNERARAHAREYVKNFDSVTAAAESLGVSQPNLSNFLARKQGAGGVLGAAHFALATRVAVEAERVAHAQSAGEETSREARQIEGERLVREAAARGEKLSLSKAMAQLRREQGGAED